MHNTVKIADSEVCDKLLVSADQCTWLKISHFGLSVAISRLNGRAPFSLSRFKVPVHPGLMIRDEP